MTQLGWRFGWVSMEIWLDWAADPGDLAGVGDLVKQGWDRLEICLCQDVS